VEGFAAPAERRLELAAGQRLGDVDFRLSRGRSVRGVVIDERTGAGIANANVSGEGTFCETGSRGLFVCDALPHSTLVLSVSKDGFARRSVVVSAGQMGPVTIPMRFLEEDDGGDHEDFEGIGIMLDPPEPDGGRGYVVTHVQSPSGAAEAGIRIGDTILSVDGNSSPVEMMDLIALIRGPAGTTVGLTVRRDGQDFDVWVTRRRLSR
jgi:S1-C subfamily serine protease